MLCSQVSVKEAKDTVSLWYKERKEVLHWQEERKKEAIESKCVRTLLGRSRHFPSVETARNAQRRHIERAAINTPGQVLLHIDRGLLFTMKDLFWISIIAVGLVLIPNII